jgi:hypothetical protein
MTQSELFRQTRTIVSNWKRLPPWRRVSDFKRMADAWLSLADSHDWLDGVVSPVLDQPSAWQAAARAMAGMERQAIAVRKADVLVSILPRRDDKFGRSLPVGSHWCGLHLCYVLR